MYRYAEAKCVAYGVDEAKINAAKEKGAASGGGAGFVSTNDLLTSAFGRQTGARVLQMAINFRGKCPLLPATGDAENYEGAVLYAPEDYQTPELIRTSLHKKKPFMRSCRDPAPPRLLPGFWSNVFTASKAMVTNWSTFALRDGVKIPDCVQGLHLPCYGLGAIPMEVSVIFRPRPGELAVMLFTRALTGRKNPFKGSDSPYSPDVISSNFVE